MRTKDDGVRTQAASLSGREASLLDMSALSAVDCIAQLRSRIDGLRDVEVRERQRSHGRNEIVSTAVASALQRLVAAFVFPFNGVLLLIAIISLVSDIAFVPAESRDFRTLIMILSMILLSSGIRFIQESRSSRAAQTLKGMIHTTCNVIRNGTAMTVPSVELVPGDVVTLSAGDIIPADARIIESKDLYLSESLLTGESMPVEKHAVRTSSATRPLDCDNLCFMGTSVSAGTARIILIHTGSASLFSSIASTLQQTPSEDAFDKGVATVTNVLLRFMAVMVPLVFVLNWWSKGSWIEALLFSMSVAVGITPEMLPMIVTTNLARGAMRMMRGKVIVKKLKAIQSLGAMQILCTDKTGTLTLDTIVLKRHINVFGDDDDEVLHWAYLNSFFQTGMKNILDDAILQHDEVERLHDVAGTYHKVDEIPFDFERRRMSVIVGDAGGRHLLVCKGAVDEMLTVCNGAYDPGDDHRLQIDMDQVLPMDDTMRGRIRDLNTHLQEDGMRVLLIAVKVLHGHEVTYARSDEHDLTLIGCIAFLDPAKPSARDSLKSLEDLGVSVVVLTGDSEVVTRKICHDVGLSVDTVVHGNEIDALSDEELVRRVSESAVCVKLSPLQKRRIVKVLQTAGNTVGFLGDGINDAPSLHTADVGISVDTAVNTAKESADIIMLEKDLHVLVEGVREGRRTFGNIMKYMKMAASSNFGNVFSMVGASIMLPFLPMLPLHILIQNLLYDISQISIPWDIMDEEYVRRPHTWNANTISRFMLWMGPVSSLFDFITFALLWFVYAFNQASLQSYFHAGWFMESMLTQVLIIHLIRTPKIPLLQSRAGTPVIIMSVLIAAVAVTLPYSFAAATIRMSPPPLTYLPALFLVLAGYTVCTQTVKRWYIRRFSDWL